MSFKNSHFIKGSVFCSVLFSILFITGSFVLSLEAQATVEENLFKFDSGFYEKIKNMQSVTNAIETKSDSAVQKSPNVHSVIIVTNDGYENQLQIILSQINATNIFVDPILDYAVADIPVDQIIPLAIETSVVKIGDGAEELVPFHTISVVKDVVGASNIGTGDYSYTGSGITVGVIDTGIDFTHPDLQGKQAGKVRCDSISCSTGNSVDEHGTALAGVVAADSANDDMDGIAPDARIYGVTPSPFPGENSIRAAANAMSLTHLLEEDILIGVSSVGTRGDRCNDYTALTIITDRAVKEGLSYSTAAGNAGRLGTGTITSISCGFNSISVGSVDVNRNRSDFSSQGPATFSTPSGDSGRIKPEITAVGEHIQILNVSRGAGLYWHGDGTSFANPQVAGIHDHTTTTSSPMKASIPSNNVDRTLNSHDKTTIRGMY